MAHPAFKTGMKIGADGVGSFTLKIVRHYDFNVLKMDFYLYRNKLTTPQTMIQTRLGDMSTEIK